MERSAPVEVLLFIFKYVHTNPEQSEIYFRDFFFAVDADSVGK
jgi:hypothetical protein